MRDHRSLLPALAITIAIGCVFAATPASGDAVTVRDAAGRTVTIKDARRIVSVGGAVDRDSLCAGPRGARRRRRHDEPLSAARAHRKAECRLHAPIVAGGRARARAARSCSPPRAQAPRKRSQCSRPRRFHSSQIPDRFTGAGIVEKIRLIAQATDAVARGECLAALVDGDLAALARQRAHITHPRKAVFILSFTNERPMVAGRTTAADGIITLAGDRMPSTNMKATSSINDEAIIAARPDAVLAMERESFRLDAQTVFAHSAFAATPAAARKALSRWKGSIFSASGRAPRAAARDLAIALYPSIERELMPSDLAALEGGCRR